MTSDLSGADISTPAVVIKFDPNVMHHGGLGVIRSLGRMGVPVYGVHEGPWAPGRQFPVSPRALLLAAKCRGRRPGACGPAAIGRENEASLPVLIATDDAGAIFLAEHGQDLRSSFLFPSPPQDLRRGGLAGKYFMYQLCREFGVPSPQAIVPESHAEAREFAASAGLPLIAKLTTPWKQGSRKLHSTSIVGDLTELEALHRACDEGSAGSCCRSSSQVASATTGSFTVTVTPAPSAGGLHRG